MLFVALTRTSGCPGGAFKASIILRFWSPDIARGALCVIHVFSLDRISEVLSVCEARSLFIKAGMLSSNFCWAAVRPLQVRRKVLPLPGVTGLHDPTV